MSESDLQDGDWYQDDQGHIWEFSYDIDAHQHRWFEIDYWICGWPEGRQIDPVERSEDS